MYQYTPEDIHKLSILLERSALSLGVTAVQIKDTVIPLHVAMDPVGPLSWALAMHAESINSLSGLTRISTANTLPFACIPNPEAPYGQEVVIQSSSFPLGAAFRLLDAALEHATCLAMRELGYAPAEWQQLPPEQRAIPLEPYFEDLGTNWITEALERGDLPMQIANWPQLLDQNSLNHQMLTQSQGEVREPALRFPSAR